MAKARTKRRSLTAVLASLRVLIVSAFAWYAVLAAAGAVLAAVGVALEYGTGHGLLVLGVFALTASELIRRGMMRSV